MCMEIQSLDIIMQSSIFSNLYAGREYLRFDKMLSVHAKSSILMKQDEQIYRFKKIKN